MTQQWPSESGHLENPGYDVAHVMPGSLRVREYRLPRRTVLWLSRRSAGEGVTMTSDQFAAALRILVGEAEDAGLELPELIAVLREQADTMQQCVDE